MATLQTFASVTGNPLVRKLEPVFPMSEDDRAAVMDACTDVRSFREHEHVTREGDRPSHVRLVLEGWAARYTLVPSGARQFTAFLIPGDFCDLHATILKEMDHSIIALTPATLAYITHEKADALRRERPELARALWWSTLVDEAISREWIVNIGRRDAHDRIAHLMCEMHMRMRNVGLADDGQFDLPLTQEELADALGLTPVHTNRMLQSLRAEGLIEFKAQSLAILDIPRLRNAAGFNASYLHGEPEQG